MAFAPIWMACVCMLRQRHLAGLLQLTFVGARPASRQVADTGKHVLEYIGAQNDLACHHAAVLADGLAFYAVGGGDNHGAPLSKGVDACCGCSRCPGCRTAALTQPPPCHTPTNVPCGYALPRQSMPPLRACNSPCCQRTPIKFLQSPCGSHPARTAMCALVHCTRQSHEGRAG